MSTLRNIALLMLIASNVYAGKFAQIPVITNGSMAATTNSIGIDLQQGLLASVQAVWTGSPVGTASIQISNDIVPISVTGSNPAASVVNWVDYTGSSTSISGAGNFIWNVLQPGYRWMRLHYVFQSGSGTMNATLDYKGD